MVGAGDLFSSPYCSEQRWGPSSPIFKVSGDAFPRGKNGLELKLYIHLYLVSKFVYLFLHLAGVGEKRNAYMVLVRKREGRDS
jgi:hypothetical protein